MAQIIRAERPVQMSASGRMRTSQSPSLSSRHHNRRRQQRTASRRGQATDSGRQHVIAPSARGHATERTVRSKSEASLQLQRQRQRHGDSSSGSVERATIASAARPQEGRIARRSDRATKHRASRASAQAATRCDLPEPLKCEVPGCGRSNSRSSDGEAAITH